MIRISYRTVAGAVLVASFLAASLPASFGQFFPPRPPADVEREPLPQPRQQPLPPPQQQFPQRQPQIIDPDDPDVEPAPRPKAKQKQKQKQKQQPVEQPPATPQGPAAPQTPETMTQPEGERIVNPTVVFSGLDKISGRIITFDVALNETVQFGALQVTPRACYTRPPTETQNTLSFVEVDEITLKSEIKRIFTGWMFASSPGLNAVEHPIYDVWLIDCKTSPPSITPSTGQQ